MHYARSLALALALATASGSGAAALNVGSGMWATGSATEIEVFGSSAGSRAFCAAGEFAHRRLDARSNDRLVLVRPFGASPTQPNQRSVGFALQGPEARTNWGGGVVLFTGARGLGLNRTVGHARSLCFHNGRENGDD